MNLKKLNHWLVAVALSTTVAACQSTNSNNNPVKTKTTNPLLTLKQIYQDHEFKSDYIGQIRWLKDGSGYTAIEKSAATTTDENGKEKSS